MRYVVRIVALGLLLPGCATTLTNAGANVLLAKADPPAECSEVGSVSAYSAGPGYLDSVKSKLRNEAAEKGANYVRLETLASDGNGAGTAFRCPEK